MSTDFVIDDATCVEDPVTVDEREQAARLASLYDCHVARVLFLPNHSAVVKDEFPSGTAVLFKSNAPLYAEPLHSSKLQTWGTSLYRCEASLVQQSAYYTDKSRRLLQTLAKKIGNSNTEGQLSLERRNIKTNTDEAGFQYVASLGSDRGSYVGLYIQSSRVGNQRVEEPVLVVQAGAPLVSQQLYKMVLDRQTYQPDTREDATRIVKAVAGSVGSSVVGQPMRAATTLTVREFLSWDETQYAINAGARMRDRIAAEVSKELGLGLKTIRDSSAGVPGVQLAIPHVHTPSYHIEDTGNNAFTYFAGSTNPQTSRHGLLLSQTPELGPVLLHGAPSSYAVRGQGWAVNASVSPISAFPIGTGRKRSDRQSMNAAQRTYRFAISGNAVSGQTFGWGGEYDYNVRMDPDHYRVRDENFVSAENKLGHNSAWGESELKPVLVLIAPSSKHRMASS